MAFVGSRHAVRFVDNDEVPPDLPQPRQDVLSLGEIERGDDALLLEPLVHAELVPDLAALEDEELRVELFLQLALPLEGEVGGADDQNALGEPAQLELADEQAGHDRFPRAGIVRQQEAHARELEQMVVNGLELVWQRVHAGNREPEVGIELVGDAERVCLQPEPEQAAVAIVAVPRVQNAELLEVATREGDLAVALGLRPHQAGDPGVGPVRADGLHAHGLAEQRAAEDLSFAQGLFLAHS